MGKETEYSPTPSEMHALSVYSFITTPDITISVVLGAKGTLEVRKKVMRLTFNHSMPRETEEIEKLEVSPRDLDIIENLFLGSIRDVEPGSAPDIANANYLRLRSAFQSLI